ncbi:hypothetical protein AAV94_13825 [Lampropedia cohaerens]|uniref:DUF4124 domain-containing protein n=1 Tax=Lampropedia cohaerens TaxID=1610491 RepID=A0A0U1PWQ9_9BURK|nr:hypothetical protein AAV94_13825 [Lampropedia cohaerens]
MLTLAWQAAALAQQGARARIYTCVDAAGRTLTSERPIPACLDRPQRIIDGVTGHLQGVLPPSYTDAEREEMARRQQALQAQKEAERERRYRERVLLTRYPTERAHQISRESAKESVQVVIAGAQARLEHLAQERQRLDAEMEFYAANPDSAPAALKRQIAANTQEMQDQQRFIDGKRAELARIDEQFDAELAELRALWARQQ